MTIDSRRTPEARFSGLADYPFDQSSSDAADLR
jgi:hypothetical protein